MRIIETYIIEDFRCTSQLHYLYKTTDNQWFRTFDGIIKYSSEAEAKELIESTLKNQ